MKVLDVLARDVGMVERHGWIGIHRPVLRPHR